MADRERCYCGAMSLTMGGYCRAHAHLDTSIAPTVTVEQQLQRTQAARDEANARIRELEAERDDLRRRLSAANKQMMLVTLGDMNVEELRPL